jgi:hypothetical protein
MDEFENQEPKPAPRRGRPFVKGDPRHAKPERPREDTAPAESLLEAFEAIAAGRPARTPLEKLCETELKKDVGGFVAALAKLRPAEKNRELGPCPHCKKNRDDPVEGPDEGTDRMMELLKDEWEFVARCAQEFREKRVVQPASPSPDPP